MTPLFSSFAGDWLPGICFLPFHCSHPSVLPGSSFPKLASNMEQLSPSTFLPTSNFMGFIYSWKEARICKCSRTSKEL